MDLTIKLDERAAHVIIKYVKCFPKSMNGQILNGWSDEKWDLEKVGQSMADGYWKFSILPPLGFNSLTDDQISSIVMYLKSEPYFKNISSSKYRIYLSTVDDVTPINLEIVLPTRCSMGMYGREYYVDLHNYDMCSDYTSKRPKVKMWNPDYFRTYKLYIFKFKFPKKIILRHFHIKDS